MKKLILFLFITSFFSCSISYKAISDVNNRIEIGMTKTQFLEIAGKRANKDKMTDNYYVYRINEYEYPKILVDVMFYYFRNSDDILFEVNAGTKMQQKEKASLK